MQAAAFSTGVTIQCPQSLAANAISKHQNERQESPFPFPADAEASSERQYRTDMEAYSMCQELAYHYACESTRQAVQEILLKSNDTSYSQVLTFFEKYCHRNASGTVANSSITEMLPPGRRRRDPNASVLFPALHGYPTAAIIAGTDATSSDLWVEPLTLKLRRTFPLCIIVPRDLATARRFIEWLAARLEKVCAAKQREEKWLKEIVDNFDLLLLEHLPAAVRSVSRRMTKHDRGIDTTKENKDESGMSGESFVESSMESDPSDDDATYGTPKSKKKQRRVAPVAYSRWSMSKLLSTIHDHIDSVNAPKSGDTSRDYIARVDEMVQSRLAKVVTHVRTNHDKQDDVVLQSIACFDKALLWLQTTILTCRNIAAKLLNVAFESRKSAAIHIGSTEMALALILLRVFHQYASLLDDCNSELPLITDRRKSIKKELTKHQRQYSLHCAKQDPVLSTPSFQPYLVLCIEHLEAISPHVFGDFLAIWTHFIRTRQEVHSIHATACTLGVVIGIASATSPALRRLDLTVTSGLELQFFSLVDSHKCFDDILEALVVHAKLPLALSGTVLRALASRHRQLPSVPRLLLALRVLLFTHFRQCPWSCLAIDTSKSSILFAADVTRLPPRVSSWLERQRRRVLRTAHANTTQFDATLVSWLSCCSALEVADLATRVASSDGMDGADKDWINRLASSLQSERQRRAQWRVGWACFRAACLWLDVQGDGRNGEHAMHLALALDGRLGEAPQFVDVVQRLQTCDWVVAAGMIQQWNASCRAFGSLKDDTVAQTLSELVALCAYARSEKTPETMLKALRTEIATVFTTRLVLTLVQPRKSESVDSLVSSWSILTDATVLDDRLRFAYHDQLCNMLQEAGIGYQDATVDGTDGEASWVQDVGLAFLFYQESASSSLSLCAWYESFSSELEAESMSGLDTRTNKRELTPLRGNPAIKARFVRALCTLRHWGFIKSDAPRDAEQDMIEKLVFI